MSRNILILSGSPRERGNSHALAEAFAQGAEAAGVPVEVIRTFALHVEPCRGCLRCNVLKRCAIKGDDWPKVAEAFRNAGGILFAAPIFFLHLPGNMKLVLDRFRSLFHVQMKAEGAGLEHTPRYDTSRPYGLILVQGARGERGVREVRELFAFITEMEGNPREVDALVGNGLGLSGQVRMDADELRRIYEKLGLPAGNAEKDAAYNRQLMQQARAMGERMAEKVRARA